MIDKRKTCCFSGYRLGKMPDMGNDDSIEVKAIKQHLSAEIFEAAKSGYENFICGCSMGFDTWAAEAVLEAKKQLDIKLICAIPFPEQSNRWQEKDILKYESIIKQSDYTYITSKKYTKDCYHIRNRFMVDNSRMLICYFDGKSGGTASTVYYAKMRGIYIINLAKRKKGCF